MIKPLHLAAQYLAAAGMSYLEKKDDDSHTNLGWSIQQQELSTRALNEHGVRLALNYTNFSLRWQLTNEQASFKLEGKSHAEVLEWIREWAKNAGLTMSYQYDFHYELPYPFPNDDFNFNEIDQAAIKQHASLLNSALLAFEEVLLDPNFESEIRVWPHHFDLGAYVQVDKIGIGLGLAIPDSSVEEFYYYVSGYEGEDSLETKRFSSLSLGEWKTGEWKAAVLKAKGISVSESTSFLKEAIHAFLRN